MAANKTRNTHRLRFVVRKGNKGYNVTVERKGRVLLQGTTEYTRAQKAEAMVNHLTKACKEGEMVMARV